MLTIVAIAVGGLALFWGWPYLWLFIVRRFIHLKVEVERGLAEIGETLEMTCTLQNTSWVRCPSVRLRVTLPEGLIADDDEQKHVMEMSTYLRERESVVFTARFRTLRRGIYSFKDAPVEVVISEGWGLRHQVIEQVIDHELVVMPGLIGSAAAHVVPTALLGNIEVRRWLFPDEALLRGIRPYQPTDAFKHIAWTASAAAGEWMAKEFSSSSEATVHLVLNAQFHENYWLGTNYEVFDNLCSRVATMANLLSRRGYRLKFWTNANYQRDPTRRFFGTQTPAGLRTLLGALKPLAVMPLFLLIESISKQGRDPLDVLLFTNCLSEKDRRLLSMERYHLHVTVLPESGLLTPSSATGSERTSRAGGGAGV